MSNIFSKVFNIVLTTVVIFTHSLLIGQNGGDYGYSFLRQPFSARLAGLSGSQLTVKDYDLGMALYNPGVLNQEQSSTVYISQAILPGLANSGSFAYAKEVDSVGTFAGFINYLSYGKIQRRDVVGNYLGEFTPGDMVVGASYGRALGDKFNVGASAKFIFSNYDG